MNTKAKNKQLEKSLRFAQRIAELALEKKAEEVKVLDVHALTSITDAFVICSGNSDLHVKAITDHILDTLAPEEKPFSTEGYENREWVLLDFVHVVVHIFHTPARRYYDLERLWQDAEIYTVEDSAVSTLPTS